MRGERARIETIGLGVELPVDLRLQHDFTAGVEAALRLLQFELAQGDLFRRAVELECDLGEFAGRAQREVAVRSELLCRATHI